MADYWHNADFPLPRAPEMFLVFETEMATFRGFLTQNCQCQREKWKRSSLLFGLVARSLLLGQVVRFLAGCSASLLAEKWRFSSRFSSPSRTQRECPWRPPCGSLPPLHSAANADLWSEMNARAASRRTNWKHDLPLERWHKSKPLVDPQYRSQPRCVGAPSCRGSSGVMCLFKRNGSP
jgi:hypothetical protein